jgi:hypothetical protein
MTRYGNEEARNVIEKILQYHQKEEKPLFVLLVGEKGLGKTSFLSELLENFL